MDKRVGWALAIAVVALGGWQWGWQGLLVGLTVVVFWLLLQFNRAVRVMGQASRAPIGSVASAVMLASKLHPGMTMLNILPLTGSLGQAQPLPPGGAADEAFAWRDAQGDQVVVRLARGKVLDWDLQRQAAG